MPLLSTGYWCLPGLINIVREKIRVLESVE